MPEKILIVDDDPNICELLRLYLTKEGYETHIAHNGHKALEMVSEISPALVLLDLMLPGIDGMQVCRNIRKFSKVPIIMLTAKDQTYDKVQGLEIGADDYITKPFEMKELIARVKAVLRRFDAKEETNPIISFDNMSIDITRYRLTVDGKEIEIPPKEMELLFFLATHPGRVYTRDQLLNEVWGYEYYGDTRTVDVHIKRIREKIENASGKWELKTVWGVGYKFEVYDENAL